MNFEFKEPKDEKVDFEEKIFKILEDDKIRLLIGEEKIEEFELELSDTESNSDVEILYNRIIKFISHKELPFSKYERSESTFENNLKIETKEKTRKQIEKIINKCKNGELDSIGKGFTAEVFQSKRCPKCCYKVIYNLEEYEVGLNIKEETLIQDALVDLNLEGARVPNPYYYKMSPDFHVMVMESLDACTIEDIERGKEKLPENFDLEVFFSALKGFISKMHSLGIHHRDLHNRNILIDRETGLPRIIDFGRAKKNCMKDLDEVYKNEDDIYIEEKGNKTIRFKPTDLDYIKVHYEKLKKIILTNKEYMK